MFPGLVVSKESSGAKFAPIIHGLLFMFLSYMSPCGRFRSIRFQTIGALKMFTFDVFDGRHVGNDCHPLPQGSRRFLVRIRMGCTCCI